MKYNFDIRVTGIHARDDMINKLKEKLDLKNNDIVYDEEALGLNCTKTILEAMATPHEENITHRLVIPDDMDVCNNFREILTKIINAHPNKVIALFPYPLEVYKDNIMLRSWENPYYFSDYTCGNGVCYPLKLLEKYINWFYKNYPQNEVYSTIHVDDYYMSKFLRENHIPTITTVPSLVQHLGANQTTLKSGISPGTTSYFVPDINFFVNWNSQKIQSFNYNIGGGLNGE